MHGVSLLRMVVVRDVRLHLQRNIVKGLLTTYFGQLAHYYFVSADQKSCRREVCLHNQKGIIRDFL